MSCTATWGQLGDSLAGLENGLLASGIVRHREGKDCAAILRVAHPAGSGDFRLSWSNSPWFNAAKGQLARSACRPAACVDHRVKA